MRSAIIALERRLDALKTGKPRIFVSIMPKQTDTPTCCYWTQARCREFVEGKPRQLAIVTYCPFIPAEDRIVMGSAGVVEGEDAVERVRKKPPCEGCEHYRIPTPEDD